MPMTDLCWVCQENSFSIMRAANTPEEEKSEVHPFNYTNMMFTYVPPYNKIVKRAEVHLLLATKARSYLKSQVKTAKDTIESHFIDRDLDVPSVGACLMPASNNITMHFSFDMAQQV